MTLISIKEVAKRLDRATSRTRQILIDLQTANPEKQFLFGGKSKVGYLVDEAILHEVLSSHRKSKTDQLDRLEYRYGHMLRRIGELEKELANLQACIHCRYGGAIE